MDTSRVRVLRTGYGARLLEGNVVLSKVLSRPGPTHELFDVFAACVRLLAGGPRLAILGFGGGGMIAPLRALGFDGPVAAVDARAEGTRLFRRLARRWAGEVEVSHQEAVAWLKRRRVFDAIVEDLTIPGVGGATKPVESFSVLPRLMRSKLSVGGVVVINALPVTGLGWAALSEHLTRPFRRARVVRYAELENRIILAGDHLPSAARISLGLRAALRGIGSREAQRITVHSIAKNSAVRALTTKNFRSATVASGGIKLVR
jgi:hypothetical protein